MIGLQAGQCQSLCHLPVTLYAPALDQVAGWVVSKACETPALREHFLCCPFPGTTWISVVFGFSWGEAEGELLAIAALWSQFQSLGDPKQVTSPSGPHHLRHNGYKILFPQN